MPDFSIRITTPVELEGAKALAEQLERDIGKAKALGQAYDELEGKLKTVNAAIAGAGKGAKEGGIEEAVGGHKGIHAIGHALDDALPGMREFTRFLTSGFTAAIGGAVLAFGWIMDKIEQFNKLIEQLNTGPGARGEWAEKMADNVKEAAVEEAVFNEKLRESAERQSTLKESTDRLIEAQKRQAADMKAVGDAQKELDLARLELAEKLGQISPDQAVQIRLEIDDAAFKRQLAAEKAAIQAELSARQGEQSAAADRAGGLGSARDQADARALAAKNAATKNAEKLAQDKKDLESLQEAQRKGQEGMSLDDFMPKWLSKFAQEGSMIDLAKSGPEQIAQMIAEKQRVIGQETKKETPLEIAAAKAKEQAEEAKKKLDDNSDALREAAKEVAKLNITLSATNAKNAALQSLHDQTSAAKSAAANAEQDKRVREGHGTVQDQHEVADRQIQQHASGERGPQAGLDASDTVAAARTAAANMRGQTLTPGQHAEIHSILQEIIGFQANQSGEVRRQADALEETRRQMQDLESRSSINR